MKNLYLAFVLALAVTVFGFWPTTVGAFGPPDAIRIVHGLFAVGWMVLLVVQSWLIGHRQNRTHRWIGWTSLVLAPGLVISALIVVLSSQGAVSHFPPDLLLILDWIDLWSLFLFAVLYVAGDSQPPDDVAALALAGLDRLRRPDPGAGPRLRHEYRSHRRPARLAAPVLLDGGGDHRGPDRPRRPQTWRLQGPLSDALRVTLAGLLAMEWTMFMAPHWPWFAAFMGAISGT
jgi:hypothetical protein